MWCPQLLFMDCWLFSLKRWSTCRHQAIFIALYCITCCRTSGSICSVPNRSRTCNRYRLNLFKARVLHFIWLLLSLLLLLTAPCAAIHRSTSIMSVITQSAHSMNHSLLVISSLIFAHLLAFIKTTLCSLISSPRAEPAGMIARRRDWGNALCINDVRQWHPVILLEWTWEARKASHISWHWIDCKVNRPRQSESKLILYVVIATIYRHINKWMALIN